MYSLFILGLAGLAFEKTSRPVFRTLLDWIDGLGWGVFPKFYPLLSKKGALLNVSFFRLSFHSLDIKWRNKEEMLFLRKASILGLI
jgi:hypothetical protein